LIKSARILNYAKRAKEFGFKSITVDFDFKDIMERVQRVIDTIEPHDSVERYSKLGVECIQGEAMIKSPWEVEVGGRTLTTQNIVVATGAAPFVPPIPGLDKVPHLVSDNLWELRELPRRLLVLGGGPIGSELAQAFARLGSEVTQVEMNAKIMNREDAEISQMVMQSFEKDGIRMLTQHKAKEFKKDGDKNILIAESNGKEVKVEFDQCLVALGRRATTTGFGLDKLGIEITPRGTIAVDEYLRTKYPNIYVCGDVTGPFQFTHTAAHQAWFCAVNALFGKFKKFKVDYRVIPWCTFTDPEVARVGLNEAEAKAKNIAYDLTNYGIDDLDRAIADEEAHGVVKVLTKPGTDQIIGVTIVGDHAGDLIAEYVSAVKHGLGLNAIMSTIHIYPDISDFPGMLQVDDI